MRWYIPLLALILFTIPAMGEWTQFKGDPQNTGVAPDSSSNPGTIRWKFITGGEVQSSPCITDEGDILIGSWDGSLYKLDRRGNMIWSRYVGEPIIATPAVHGDTVYVIDMKGTVYTFDLDGTSGWRYRSREGVAHSSPAVDPSGNIYYGTDAGSLFCLRPDGVPRWVFKAGDYIDSPPSINPVDGSVYFGCGDGKLYALGPLGRLKWSYGTGGPISSAACIGPSIYSASEDGYIYSVRANGTLEWRTRIEPVHLSSPSSAGSDIFVGTLSGRLYCLDRRGSVRWSFRANGPIECSPILSGERVIFGSTGNSTYCIDGDGDLVWELPLDSWVRSSSPAVDEDGTIYLGTGEGSVIAIGAPFPGPPRFLISRSGDGRIDLSWSPPLEDGEVIGYNVYRWNGSGWSLITVTLSEGYSDTGLTNGRTYSYAVTALNEVGEGMMSNTAEDIPVKRDPPGPIIEEVDESGSIWMIVVGSALILMIIGLLIWQFWPRRGRE